MPDRKLGLNAALSGLEGSHAPSSQFRNGGEGGRDPVDGGAAVQAEGLFGALPAAGEAAPGRAGPGRPPGAPNKRTGKLKDWILALGYRHPAVVLAELASAEVGDLAKALACKKLEAAELKRKAAIDLLPYFESKMPTTVELPEGELVPVLNIGVMPTRRAAAGDGAMSLLDAFDATIEESQQDQGLSDPASVRPGEEGSHDDG